MAGTAVVGHKDQDDEINKTAPLWAVFVVGLYFFSGVAALSYEVLWARLLSLQFGVSIFGVVVTVAAFMAGLGMGSLIGSKISPRRSPLFILALVELTVAIFAFTVPVIFSSAEDLMGYFSTSMGFGGWFAWQLVFALLVLFLPAAALGLGFPLVLRVLRNQHVSLGTVYGLNALGGAVGAVLPLLLLPVFGLVTSLYLVASLGVLLAIAFFLGAHWQARSELGQSGGAVKATPDKGARFGQLPAVSLWAYSLLGAGSLILQISWTRLYGMLLLRTEYILGVILAVFLLGMALGSLFLRVHHRTTYWLTLLPILSAFGVVIGLWFLPWVAEFAADGHYDSLWSALFWQGLCVALFTLPVTFALGAWLPVLTHNFKAHGVTVGAKFYGANALGSALGALLAGFVLLPLFGSAAVVCLAAFILLLAGLYFSPIKKAQLIALPLVLLTWPVLELPQVSVLLPKTLADTRDIYEYEDAISITHVVERSDGQRLLLGDLQRMDASSEPTAVVSQQNQARLPLLLHAEPKSVLFLGVGTGISMSGSLAYEGITRVGVEISQGAIEAARSYFSQVNNQIIEMEGVHVIRDDARRYLKSTSDDYDVIVGDLFHPDLVGRSALLSVEQFHRVKSRLTPDGVFVQWLALNQFDVESLRVVLRTFGQVFGSAHLYLDGFRLAMVGRMDEAGDAAPALLANLSSLDRGKQNFATGGEGAWTWLGRYFGPINSSGRLVQRELTPVIEYRLPRARYEGDLNLSEALLFLLKIRPMVGDAAEQLGVAKGDFSDFERAYMAVELGVRSWIAAVEGRQGEAERFIRFAYSANPMDRWVGFDLADRMYATLDQAVASGYLRSSALTRILDIRPDHEQALKEMLRLSREMGDKVRERDYYEKLRVLSPLGKDL